MEKLFKYLMHNIFRILFAYVTISLIWCINKKNPCISEWWLKYERKTILDSQSEESLAECPLVQEHFPTRQPVYGDPKHWLS